MGGLLDASVVVRYLANDHPEHFERAVALIESDRQLTLAPVTIVEVGYVLMRTYGVPRIDVVDALLQLIATDNIDTSPVEKATMATALSMCRDSGRISIADAMIWAAAFDNGEMVYTFDRRFPTNGVQVVFTP